MHICKIFSTFAADFESMRTILFILALVSTYVGRVVDQNGEPVPYATVYPVSQPQTGTATNNDGYFSFKTDLTSEDKVIVSCIGYEKQEVFSEILLANEDTVMTVVLHEQPIALEETVVAAKASKQKNKRKQMAVLLHAVYVKLEEEFPDNNSQYQIVSDVRMQSEGNTWGMEQMIANIIVMPEQAQGGLDSVQFQGKYCKRFFDAEKRAQADQLMSGDALDRIQKKSKNPIGAPAHFMKKAANAVDSGVVVHKTLFSWGNMRYDFEQEMNDIKHWSVSNESEGETVLTYTEKINKYLGCFKVTVKRHYIVDSRTYAVRRFSEHMDVKITIPFGVKLNADQLQMLNLVNMDEKRIEKFRLKKMNGVVDYNTIYQRRNGHVYTLEKNMVTNVSILGSKKTEIPLIIQATQRVTELQTEGITPMPQSSITKRLKREIVEIY